MIPQKHTTLKYRYKLWKTDWKVPEFMLLVLRCILRMYKQHPRKRAPQPTPTSYLMPTHFPWNGVGYKTLDLKKDPTPNSFPTNNKTGGVPIVAQCVSLSMHVHLGCWDQEDLQVPLDVNWMYIIKTLKTRLRSNVCGLQQMQITQNSPDSREWKTILSALLALSCMGFPSDPSISGHLSKHKREGGAIGW